MVSILLCIVFCVLVESGSVEERLSASTTKDQLSGGALAGIVVLGMVATLLAIVVVIMALYVRRGAVHKLRNGEKLPLITTTTTTSVHYIKPAFYYYRM